MLKISRVCWYHLLISILTFSLDAQDFESLDPYKYRFIGPSYSNYGTIGLIQMPSARLLKEGSLGFSWSNNAPYLRGSLIGYPFNWLEVSYQYTDIDNKLYSDVEEFSGRQSYKDKSFDIKVMLLKETSYVPQVSIGARDLAGTGIFSSEYLVASKLINNLDFTIGIGWGNLSNNRFKNPFSFLSKRFNDRSLKLQDQGGEFNTSAFFRGKADLFLGAEIYLPNTKGKRFKIEYDTTNYFQEGFNDTGFGKKKKQASKVNIGFIHAISDNFHYKVSYTKGNTLSFGFSYSANLSKKNPLVPKRDPYLPVDNSKIVQNVTSSDDQRLYRASLKYLQDREIFLQKAGVLDNKYFVQYSQSKFHSPVQAAGRVFLTLDEIAPSKIDELIVSEINGGILMNTFAINREIFRNNRANNLYAITKNYTDVSRDISEDNYLYKPKSKYPKSFYKFSPAIRSQIGGPDGFYFGQLSLALNAETLLAKNISLITTFNIGLLDNFDNLNNNSDSILPHVRTDQVFYLKNSTDLHLKRLQLNTFFNPKDDFYFKATFGILESMFGGYGTEFLWRPFGRNFGIGAEAWHVKQRETDMLFDFRKYETNTGFINFYYDEPKTGIFTYIKAGKFLAKDSGFNINMSRKFKSGLRMGVFFSVTDISKEEFGEGSFDKGFFFFFPIDIFFQSYSRNETGFGLRPITRDGAAVLNHSHSLWGITDHASMSTISKDWDDYYD